MKAAVFLSSGLGNSLLLTPLIKELNKRGDEVTVIATSGYGGDEVIGTTHLAKKTIRVPGGWFSWVRSALAHWNAFDVAYLDHFSSDRKTLTLASCLSQAIVAQRLPEGTPGWIRKKTTVIPPIQGGHAATQNLQLVLPGTNTLHPNQLSLPLARELSRTQGPNGPFICLQLGSANGETTYKNWSAERWEELATRITTDDNPMEVVILGDRSEMELAKKVKGSNSRIHTMAGETSLTEAMAWLKDGTLFMGADSGLMHLAAALGTPTLTLWGPSDPTLYSWKQIDPVNHAVITAAPECGPCNSWLNPNTSRVSDPLKCPDYRCMKDISVEQVHEALTKHWKQLQNQPL